MEFLLHKTNSFIKNSTTHNFLSAKLENHTNNKHYCQTTTKDDLKYDK